MFKKKVTFKDLDREIDRIETKLLNFRLIPREYDSENYTFYFARSQYGIDVDDVVRLILDHLGLELSGPKVKGAILVEKKK